MIIDYLKSEDFLMHLTVVLCTIAFLYELSTGKFRRWAEKGNIENAAEYCSLVSGGRVSCVIMEGSGMPLVNSDSSWTPLSSRILRDELRSRNSGTVRVIFACRPQLAFKHESGELLVQFDYHYLILTTAPKDNHDRWFN